MRYKSPFVVFDLDDTLYKEVDYLESAYKEIAFFVENKCPATHITIFEDMKAWYYEGANAFKNLLEKYHLSGVEISTLLTLYRNHKPDIQLPTESREVLDILQKMKIPIGIMTDGRSVQQRNKIDILGLENYAKDILISEEFGSEKPAERNYQHFMKDTLNLNYFYIGDNTKKDFITANKLGWTTICLLDNGTNIHPQNFTLPKAYLPKYQIHSLTEILSLLEATS